MNGLNTKRLKGKHMSDVWKTQSSSGETDALTSHETSPRMMLLTVSASSSNYAIRSTWSEAR